jgi:hypothetical protein
MLQTQSLFGRAPTPRSQLIGETMRPRVLRPGKESHRKNCFHKKYDRKPVQANWESLQLIIVYTIWSPSWPIEHRWPVHCRLRWSFHLRSSGMAEMLLGFGLERRILSSTAFEKFWETSWISFVQRKSNQPFQSGSHFPVGGCLRTTLVSKQAKSWFTVEKLWGLWHERKDIVEWCLNQFNILAQLFQIFLVVACVTGV